MKRLAILFLVLFPCVAAPQSTRPKATAAPVRPSLDLLVARVDSYWKLLLKQQRSQAANYVVPSERNKFLSGTTPQFREPQLKSFELSADRAEAVVTVMTKRLIPYLASEMDFPVIERWIFQRGNWYCRYASQPLPIAPTNAEQAKIARQEIRDRLHFQQTAFDFGNVRQGANVMITLKYSLSGDDPIRVAIRSAGPAPDGGCPSCGGERSINMSGRDEQELSPGSDREISVEVPTWSYDGVVNERFFVVAKLKNLEVPFEFSIKGNVYAPAALYPRVLRFKSGEREKKVVIRNHSKSDLEINQVISETRAIRLEPLPALVPAGKELDLTIKVDETLDSAAPNTIDNLAITFTKDIDGMPSLRLPVYVNSHEEKQGSAANPAAGSQTQDPTRQNQTKPPTR